MVGTMMARRKQTAAKPCMSVAAGATSFRIIPARFTAPRCRSTAADCRDYIHRFDTLLPDLRHTGVHYPNWLVYSAGSAHTSRGRFLRTVHSASETLPNGNELHQQRLHATLAPSADGRAATRRTSRTILNGNQSYIHRSFLRCGRH